MAERINGFFKSSLFVNFIFFLFIFLSLIFFSFSFFINSNRLNIPFLGGVNADVRVNVEADNFDKIQVFVNDKSLTPSDFKLGYATFDLNNYPVYSIKIKEINDIKNVVLTVGDKLFYYTKEDILSFRQSNDKYIFPEVKLFNSSKYINDRGILTEFAVKFLSLFYSPNLYILPLFCLFFAFLIYFFNKEKINIFKKRGLIFYILFLALILRLQGNSFPFWGDELYTATVAGNPNLPFLSVFSDPGNPPFFFIIERFYQSFTGESHLLLRLLPCVFSVFFNLCSL